MPALRASCRMAKRVAEKQRLDKMALPEVYCNPNLGWQSKGNGNTMCQPCVFGYIFHGVSIRMDWGAAVYYYAPGRICCIRVVVGVCYATETRR